ncbi:MAG: DUF1844 domain-containing protein [Deltaproteobacteria bacterium]|nr:DUF1844 domain-containing protein [Deltaproteobacteria bacterium]
MVENNGEKGFVIKDRRLFDEEGKMREEEAQKKEAPPEPKVEQKVEGEKPKVEKEEKAGPGREEQYQVPEMNFHNFVLSLYTSVIFSLGEVPDSVSGEKKKDLQAAKQTIDLLGMIQEKTKGNLDASEKELLEGVLSESRMRFVRERDKA